MSRIRANFQSFTANFVRSKLFLLRFLTMTAKKAEGSVEAVSENQIFLVSSARIVHIGIALRSSRILLELLIQQIKKK